MLKLVGSGACSPRKILKFTTSETASETTFMNKNDKILIVGNFHGQSGRSLVLHPLDKSLNGAVVNSNFQELTGKL